MLKFYNNFNCGAGFFNNNAFRKNIIGVCGGGCALLSLSLFGTSKKEEETKDEQSNLLLIREADLYFESGLVDNAYNVLRRHRSSENPELLWRLARVLYKQGRATRNKEEEKRLYYEAFEFAKKALANQPSTGSFGANKWYAILLDKVAELEGTKERIQKAMDVKSHFERALELNPTDATTWHLLGVWHYELADLPTHMRWAASLIYAKPPETTYDEALRCFERAETISPNFYSANNYYLGLVYEKINRRTEALEQFKKAFYAPMVDLDDRVYHEKAMKHLQQNYKYKVETLLKEREEAK